eukprot:1655636-Pyramimonas_sp.AAC.1
MVTERRGRRGPSIQNENPTPQDGWKKCYQRLIDEPLQCRPLSPVQRRPLHCRGRARRCQPGVPR